MSSVVNILITLLIFLVIIMIHECGHFIVAKLSGIQVNEFSLGMGPAIFRKQTASTLYSIRAFPVGGYVSMEGEDDSSANPRAFCNAKLWKRILVVVAGALMNLLLGFFILVAIVSATPKITSNTIAEISEGTSLAASGLLKPGDTILKINGRSTWVDNDIVYELLRDADGIVDFTVKRDGQTVQVPGVPFDFEEQEDGSRALIIGFKVVGQEKSVGSVLSYSLRKTGSIARIVWISFLDLITGHASLNDLSGPIGMTQVVGEAAKVGFSSLFLLIAFVTINVGIFNLLPIPALDGGRLLFLLIELIFRRPVKKEYEGYIHTAGFILLILLMVVIAFHDVWRLFQA